MQIIICRTGKRSCCAGITDQHATYAGDCRRGLSILMVIAAAGFVVFDIGRAINPEFLKNIKTDK